MAIHNVSFELTDAENAALSSIAFNIGKTANELIIEMVDELVLGQIRQWIKDEAKTLFNTVDAAEFIAQVKKG